MFYLKLKGIWNLCVEAVHMLTTLVFERLMIKCPPVIDDLFKSGMKSAADCLLGVGAPLHMCSDVMWILFWPPLT